MQRELRQREQTLRQEFQGASKESKQTLELVLHKLGIRRRETARRLGGYFDPLHFDRIFDQNMDSTFLVKPELAALYENLGGN